MRWLDARLVFILVLVLVPGLVRLILILFFEGHASLTVIAFRTVIAVLVIIADVFYRRQFIALGRAGEGLNNFILQHDQVALNVLRGDLEAVEKECGAAGVEARGAKIIEDLGEGELDCGRVFRDWELEGFIGGGPWRVGEAVYAGVEVAIGHATEGGRLAPESIGLDVTAFGIHIGPPVLAGKCTTPPRYFANKILIFMTLRRGCRRKIL
jgi:hypothetical protein